MLKILLCRAALTLTVSAFALASAHAQVNKCTVAGQVVYQAEPCAAGGEKVNVSGAGKADANAPGANYYKKEAGRLAHKERVENAILSREVFIGMTADEVVQSWGKPIRVNVSVTAKGRDEQWVYGRVAGMDQAVYLTNGEVRNIQGTQ